MARSKSTHRVSIRDLMAAGYLAPGDNLRFEPRRGEVYTGQIEHDGGLSFGGDRFPTPSNAATSLARRSGENPNDSRNGWKEIQCKGKPLQEYRDEYERRHPGAAPRTPYQSSPTTTPAPFPPAPVAGPVASQANSERSPTVGEAKPEPQDPGRPSSGTLHEQLLGKLTHMSDRDFEEFVGRILVRLGYEDVNVVGRSGDRGLDIECIHRLPLVEPPISVACQVKRHIGTVGGSVVGDLRGRWAHRADRLILVNLGGFSAGAREEAVEQPGAKPVKLISGDDLADLMTREGIGVHREPVVKESIDETFFGPFAS